MKIKEHKVLLLSLYEALNSPYTNFIINIYLFNSIQLDIDKPSLLLYLHTSHT